MVEYINPVVHSTQVMGRWSTSVGTLFQKVDGM
jgi:hypothetical protein